MKLNKILYITMIGILSLALSSCGASQIESTPTPTVQPSPTTVPTISAGACTNPYLPIIVGATWNYSMTGFTSDTFTHSILSADSASFTDQDVFGKGVTRQSKWNCDNGNLIALDPTQGGAASVVAANIKTDFQTTELSGVTLPATINAGDTWSQTITLEGTGELSGIQFPARTHTVANCTGIGPESVTVQAGTFDAMRFECQITIDISATINGVENKTTVNINTNNWHALNIGMVKTIASGDGVSSTIELVSYNIP